MLATSPCPCQSNKPYSDCCQPYHLHLSAPTVLALMRSRYTAYVLGLEDYLLQTWHPTTRPAALNLANDTQTRWLGLQIKHFENTDENHAVVEFIARYKINGKAERMHEISQFVCVDGRHYYLSAKE